MREWVFAPVFYQVLVNELVSVNVTLLFIQIRNKIITIANS